MNSQYGTYFKQILGEDMKTDAVAMKIGVCYIQQIKNT